MRESERASCDIVELDTLMRSNSLSTILHKKVEKHRLALVQPLVIDLLCRTSENHAMNEHCGNSNVCQCMSITCYDAFSGGNWLWDCWMNTPQNDGARPDVAETYLNCHIFFLEHHIYIQLYGASSLYVLHVTWSLSWIMQNCMNTPPIDNYK